MQAYIHFENYTFQIFIFTFQFHTYIYLQSLYHSIGQIDGRGSARRHDLVFCQNRVTKRRRNNIVNPNRYDQNELEGSYFIEGVILNNRGMPMCSL